MKNRRPYILLLAVSFLPLLPFFIMEFRTASALGFPLDDSWIFWVFAKNLATGEGFSFNPGEPGREDWAKRKAIEYRPFPPP